MTPIYGAAMTAIEKVLKFCDDARIVFKRAPATSDYQHGYEAAVEDMMRVAVEAQEDEPETES
jgi:hypothetical protein